MILEMLRGVTMGLDVYARGLSDEASFSCGYLTYGSFLMKLCDTAYGDEMGDIYRRMCFTIGSKVTQEEIDYWNGHCNDDLDLLLFHSDCDGKFTPKECRRIYNAIKDLKMDMQGHNYGVMEPYNMLEHWKAMFKHCADRRVNMYYG